MSDSTVRYRDDVGYELRCPDCASLGRSCFWPLTDEYWDKRRGFRRCRACQGALDARRAKARYLSNTTARERKREASRRYYAATRQAQRLRHQDRWQAIKTDPERHAQEIARVREAQRRYRERRKAA